VSSSIGRRASRAGWIGVAVAALLFTASSSAVMMAGLETTRARPITTAPGGATAAPGGAAAVPVARMDDRLYDGSTVTVDEPFTIRVSAENPASRPTDPVWLVLAWQPSAADPGQRTDGVLVACEPVDCESWDDPVAHTTVVRWPGLAAGASSTFVATVLVSGLGAGTTFHYQATAGSGPDAAAIHDGSTWDLDLLVEAQDE
jgi:hypothetical protein